MNPIKNNNTTQLTNHNLPITINSKIVVFGGTGLVGSAIIKKLLEKGYKNIIATYHNRKPNNSTFNIQHSTLSANSVIFIKLDLTNQQSVENFFKEHKPELVILAAARVGGILANDTYKADFIYDNIVIAANIIHAAYKYGVKKLLNLGSSCIYPKFAKQPIKEKYLLTGELEPTNEPYAIAKISAIKLCRYFNEQYGTNFLSVMPTNLYGPNDNFDLEKSHVLPALLRKVHLGKYLEENDWKEIRKDLDKNPIEGIDGSASKETILNILSKYGIKIVSSKRLIDNGEQVADGNVSRNKETTHHSPLTTHSILIEIWGSGNPFREFLHVDDMADACVFVVENIEAKDMRKLSLDYFVNIGTGKDIRIKELVELIKEIVGYKGEIAYNKEKPDGTPRKLLDIERIHSLGWKHKIELEEGLKMYYDWYLSQSFGGL